MTPPPNTVEDVLCTCGVTERVWGVEAAVPLRMVVPRSQPPTFERLAFAIDDGGWGMHYGGEGQGGGDVSRGCVRSAPSCKRTVLVILHSAESTLVCISS